MASGNYYGKDGTFYETWNEMRQANAKWEQQERQNNLLREQNRLIREEQERQNNLLREQQERIARQKREENFNHKWETELFPLMKEAGIKEPLEYVVKLRELYKSKPIKVPEISKIKKLSEIKIVIGKFINSLSREQKNNLDMFTKLSKNIKEVTKPLNRVQNLCRIIPLILCGSIVVLSAGTGEDIPILLSFIFSLIVIIVDIIIYKKILRDNPALDKEEITKEINVLIEKQNKENRKEMQEWENKIKNYEQKRLQNFNFLLEIALEKLGVAISELNKEKINFMLQFHKYPNEYEEKKKEYFNKQNTNKAKKDGTEIFLDL